MVSPSRKSNSNTDLFCNEGIIIFFSVPLSLGPRFQPISYLATSNEHESRFGRCQTSIKLGSEDLKARSKIPTGRSRRRPRRSQADFAVELGDQPLEGADLSGEHLLPVFRLLLGRRLLAGLALLLDPGEIFEVVHGLPAVVPQLLEPVESPGRSVFRFVADRPPFFIHE